MFIDTAFSDDELPDEYWKRLGTFVKAKRQLLGKTQLVLGVEIGLDQAATSRIERGIQRTRMATLFKLAKALGTSMCDLIAAAEGVADIDDPRKEKELKIAWHLSSLPDEKLYALAVVLDIKFNS
jgi:transcriptional regulator with XRE-family HTH domain